MKANTSVSFLNPVCTKGNTSSSSLFCTMYTVLFLLLSSLVLRVATENGKVETKCRRDVVLQCTAEVKPGLQYMAVRWYKEGEQSDSLRGLVSRVLPDGGMRWYLGASKDVSLVNDSLDLQLSNVSCSDAGVYQCYLAAPVGEQNREGLVQLSVTDCPTVVQAALEKLNNNYMIVLGAVGVLFLSLLIFLFSYRNLKNMLWLKTKTPEKEIYSDPCRLPEKEELMLIYTLGPSPSKNFSPKFIGV